MASNSTVLCIHRDPAQLSLSQQHGYELLTATNGCEGLRLFASQPVDAIVLDYHLGLLDGLVVANEIKRVRPTIPIVMLADNLDFPDSALRSIDALVTRADGAHFLWATVHFVLNVKPVQARQEQLPTQAPGILRRLGRPAEPAEPAKPLHTKAPTALNAAPFSAKEWKNIRTGTVQF
jgi:CheY-like chemotaxis protein